MEILWTQKDNFTKDRIGPNIEKLKELSFSRFHYKISRLKTFKDKNALH